jgi:nicotinamidase-related amidase
MSGIWGYQTALDLFLKENGITTLLLSGVNTDQVRTSCARTPKENPYRFEGN